MANPLGAFAGDEICRRCNGSRKCPRCDGTGIVEDEEEEASNGGSSAEPGSSDRSNDSSSGLESHSSDYGGSYSSGGGSSYSPPTKEKNDSWSVILLLLVAIGSVVLFITKQPKARFSESVTPLPDVSSRPALRSRQGPDPLRSPLPDANIATPPRFRTSTPATKAEGPLYSGSGTLYKVPELKRLVGKRLDNAWLYGDFILKSVEGNKGYFTTAAWIGLPKEGGTQVEIEFPSGIALSEQTRRVLRDRLLVRTISFRKTPLQLLSVRREPEGNLFVKARGYGVLR